MTNRSAVRVVNKNKILVYARNVGHGCRVYSRVKIIDLRSSSVKASFPRSSQTGGGGGNKSKTRYGRLIGGGGGGKLRKRRTARESTGLLRRRTIVRYRGIWCYSWSLRRKKHHTEEIIIPIYYHYTYPVACDRALISAAVNVCRRTSDDNADRGPSVASQWSSWTSPHTQRPCENSAHRQYTCVYPLYAYVNIGIQCARTRNTVTAVRDRVDHVDRRNIPARIAALLHIQ